MMNKSRREFLKGGVAFGGLVAASALRVFADEANGRRLRIGILSDTHLDGGAVAAQKLERALLAFRRGRVDGVLICGDLADNGVVPQLEELARVWEKVFPDSRGLDGEHVERLFHCGDHDNRGRWQTGEDERVRKQYGWTVGRLLSAYPNCCAFCGHSHQTAAREDAIWQGAFTVVQVPSLKYVTREAGHENKPRGEA